MEVRGYERVSVDPAVLKETAERAFVQIATYRQGLEKIAGSVSSSADSWVGEAGDAFRAVFKAELAKVEESLDEFEKYPRELLEYEQIYSAAMEKAAGQVESVSEFRME